MASARVSIQIEDFDLSAEIAALHGRDARVGAVCSFVGTVRDRNDGSTVHTLELEHYPGMTEKAIESMIDEAHRRFDIFAARVVHRVGRMQPLEQILRHMGKGRQPGRGKEGSRRDPQQGSGSHVQLALI